MQHRTFGREFKLEAVLLIKERGIAMSVKPLARLFRRIVLDGGVKAHKQADCPRPAP